MDYFKSNIFFGTSGCVLYLFYPHKGHHELSCAGKGRRILRHNAIRDCLFDLGLKAAMTVRKEPSLLCDGTGDKPADVLFASFSQGRDLCVDVTVVNPLIDIYEKMKHEDNYLAEAVKQKNNRYAERCNAAGLNFMACAFEATGAICKGDAAHRSYRS